MMQLYILSPTHSLTVNHLILTLVLDFEPIQEEILHQPNAEMLLYEEYSRRELPRLFRNALENVVSEETQHLEERLRDELVNMIQDCQDRVLFNYRSLNINGRPTEAAEQTEGARNSIANSCLDLPPLLNDLETFYKRPPPIEATGRRFSQSTISEETGRRFSQATTSRQLQRVESADSGYTSATPEGKIPQILNTSEANNGHMDIRVQPRADDYRSCSPPVPDFLSSETYSTNTSMLQEEDQTLWCTQMEDHWEMDMSGIPGPDFGEFVELKQNS
jgi:hypothetical protein